MFKRGSKKEVVGTEDAAADASASAGMEGHGPKLNVGAPTENQVMVSLHVSSMKSSVAELTKRLEAKGLATWSCLEVPSGANYRDHIFDAVSTCQFMVLLINQEWADSAECEDEFLLAKRLNLTSHASGRSKKGEPRYPVFIPVAFPNLDWNSNRHVYQLSTSTNFIIHDADTLLQGTDTFSVIMSALAQHGANIDVPLSLLPATPNGAGGSKGGSGGSESTRPAPGTLALSIQSAVSAAQGHLVLLASLSSQIGSLLNIESPDPLQETADVPTIAENSPFMGLTTGEYKCCRWTDATEFRITSLDHSASTFEGVVVQEELNKEPVNAQGEAFSRGAGAAWFKTRRKITYYLKGTISNDAGLVTGKSYRATASDTPNWNTTVEFSLVLFKNFLIGTRVSSTDTARKSRVVLKKI
jgi:hypothetical protein